MKIMAMCISSIKETLTGDKEKLKQNVELEKHDHKKRQTEEELGEDVWE